MKTASDNQVIRVFVGIRAPTRFRIYDRSRKDWAKFFGKLRAFQQLTPDELGAAVPNVSAVSNASLFLERLQEGDLCPQQVAPSVVGGVGITLRNQQRKAYVEFSNKGTVLALFSDGVCGTSVTKEDPKHFGLLVARIGAYLDE